MEVQFGKNYITFFLSREAGAFAETKKNKRRSQAQNGKKIFVK